MTIHLERRGDAVEVKFHFAYAIVVAVCLGLPCWGGVCAQDGGASNETGAAASASAPQTVDTKPESQQTQPANPGTGSPSGENKIQATKKADAASVSSAKKRHVIKKHPATASQDAPQRVVVRHGSTAEPTAQIVTGMAPAEANRERMDAERLLSLTDATVKRAAPGPVDAPRQETVEQIHNYMKGARSALREGDISRAHTLAQKASLLAADLERH
jgi:hypothetical protein